MPTQTLALTDFLLARIGEDEAVALAARSESPTPWVNDEGTVQDAGHCSIAGYAGEATAPHIVLHDPARVLAECEAKRRIVEDYQGVLLRPALAKHATVQGYTAALEGVLAALALPYADHPDYREEWRP